MSWAAFLDLPPALPRQADVLLLPLPYEGTVSYGRGTARGPEAIWRASAEVELWDEQAEFDLAALRFHTAAAVAAEEDETPADYLSRVERAAAALHGHGGLVVGVGGEHALTPPLVQAAAGGTDDLSGVTVVQLDAHFDLRDTYLGSPHSHACAIRRLVERSARVLAVGVRSAAREEADFARQTDRVLSFPARQLGDPALEHELLTALRGLSGDVYLTIDIDVLEVGLCPGTGTPQPGGLSWWQTTRYLQALLVENPKCRLIGLDLVETVPQPQTQVNEFTAALLLTKAISFHAAATARGRRPES
ncbi:MAG: agmatinase [Pirellulales bacterium]|nr:agmatinase [Pirellulales bacterium]